MHSINHKTPKVAVIGATGNVGRHVMCQLLEGGLEATQLMAIGLNSCGSSFDIQGHIFHVDTLETLERCTVAILATQAHVSRTLYPQIKQKANFVLDASSAFRMDEDVPLICFPVNGQKVHNAHTLYAHANCIASPVSIALFPLLNKIFPSISHIFLSTYQSVSGAGWASMHALKQDSLDFLNDNFLDEKRHQSMAFNLRPEIGAWSGENQTGEEHKVQEEVCKILDSPLKIHAQCVRVPVFQGHAVSLWIAFENPVCLKSIRQELAKQPGLVLDETYSTPHQILGQDNVHIGRIYQTDEKHVHFWLCSDNLRRGASTDLVETAWALLR